VIAQGPVIPEFGRGSECVRENRTFCFEWAAQNWDNEFAPRLVEHLWLVGIAVSVGFAVALAAALAAYRWTRLEAPIGFASAFLYTIPSLALFQLLVPFTGISLLTVEIALVSYTLLILFRNMLAGLRSAGPDVREAARGMGLTDAQSLVRVELPLALPAILAGLRIAVVTTISLATVAAFLIPEGLGAPIFGGLREYFKTRFIMAGGLAVLLALVADALLVVLGRAVTPWARRRRAA
jgi:osmoprotectant transport system permease protein